jgi:hypothetical protein
MAETQAGADVGIDGGYSSAPFSGVNSKSAGTLKLRANPRVEVQHSTGNITLSGGVTQTFYSRIYNDTTDYNAALTALEQVSPRTSLHARLGFDSSVLNNNELILNPVAPVSPTGPNELPPVVDATASNFQGQRRDSFTGVLGVDHQLSERDKVSLSVNGAAVRGEAHSTIADYDYGAASGQYSRQVSGKVSLGISMTGSHTNYRGTRIGDATTYSPALTATVDFGHGWTLSGSGGATFVDQQTLLGERNNTFGSGSLTACHRGERLNFCFSGNQSVSPATNGTVGNQTSVGANATYQLDEFSTLSGSVSYARNHRIQQVGSTVDDYLSSRLGYSRRITERLSGRAETGYSDSFRSTTSYKANFWATIGVSYRIGTI